MRHLASFIFQLRSSTNANDPRHPNNRNCPSPDQTTQILILAVIPEIVIITLGMSFGI